MLASTVFMNMHGTIFISHVLFYLFTLRSSSLSGFPLNTIYVSEIFEIKMIVVALSGLKDQVYT